MQDNHFIVNFYAHPTDRAAGNNARMDIDMAVLLPVGTDALARAVEMAGERHDEFILFYWVDHTRDLGDEPQRLRRAVKEWGVRGEERWHGDCLATENGSQAGWGDRNPLV